MGRQSLDGRTARQLDWLLERGLSPAELQELNPCVPGEFTLPDTYYVNTGSPGVIYAGTEEGTLPLVAGKWYFIPRHIVGHNPDLTREPQRLARARRLIR
jgi:hypothetical protein